MPSIVRRGEPQLTESWASMNRDEDGSTESFSSGEEIDESEAAQTRLTDSRIDNLNDAMGMKRERKSSATTTSTGPGRLDPRRSGMQSSVNASQSDLRKRAAGTTSRGEGSSFVMPTLKQSGGRSLASSRSNIARSPPRRTNRPPNERQSRPARSEKDKSGHGDMLSTIWSSILAPGLRFLFSVVKLAAGYAKPVVAYVLAIWLLVGCLIMMRNLLTTTISSALSPICRVPGVSLIGLPFCAPSNNSASTPPAEFDKLVSAQAAFEDVLTGSAGGASLPLDMKHSEASIRDLKHVVQYSNLPSRNELVFEFGGFIDTARQAATDLTRFNSRIGRAVDRILTTNRWTLQVLDGIAATEASQGSVSRFVSNNLNIFAPFQKTPRLNQDVLFDQYIRHTSAIEEQVQDLVTEAQALLAILQHLDDRLDLIAGIAARDGIKAQGDRDQLFAMLWTKVGGNRASVDKVERQMAILRDLGNYRKMAWAHVSGTMIKLQAIAANLEDLRERVARPETVGVREELPLEMHVREIVMGVERLENVREEGRSIEHRRIRGILDRGDRMGVEAS